jgi:antiviral helicase SKI2
VIVKYAVTHDERQLQSQLAELAHNISDQNLELLPDYHQRIEVLKILKFIDENSTVQLKGRVACEVCLYPLKNPLRIVLIDNI